MNKYLILIIGCVTSFALDQYTKWQILANFELRDVAELIPGHVALTYVRNTGAAFGILSHFGRPFFLLVTLLAIAFIVYFFWRIDPARKRMALAISLILGGALGNFYDRIFHGFVIDFIQVHIFGRYQWPTFNVADISICMGVCILIFELLLLDQDDIWQKQGETT